MSIELDSYEGLDNPLDSVEEILSANNWVFSRTNNDELMVEVRGKACSYRLFFIWQEDMSAMQFCAQYDMAVHPMNMDMAGRTLRKINENAWLGHFDIPFDTRKPCFRYTALLRGLNGPGCADLVEDLVDISMAQCERYYLAFQLLSVRQPANDETMSLALMDTAGES